MQLQNLLGTELDVNGDIRTTCIDTETVDGWQEYLQNEEPDSISEEV